jgi:hypothetical protein
MSGGRILIYDNATGNDSIGDGRNYVNLNYTLANAAPTAADTVLYGSATYQVIDYPNTGPAFPTVGAAVFAPGANVTFSTVEHSRYILGSIIQPYGSAVRFNAPLSAGNVLIGPGASLDLHPGGPGLVYDAISNLWNEGGTLSIDPSVGLQLGGPGFIQTGGIGAHETEVHAGINQWINLGNVAHGSAVAPLDFTLLNETGATEVGFLYGTGDGGFTPEVPTKAPTGVFAGGEHDAGAIKVNTSTLGGHWEQLSYGSGSGTIATTAVFDNVVKA